MRRLFLSLLLLFVGLPAVAPILLLRSGDVAAVPACCRRAGAHHCLMTEGAASPVDETAVVMRAPAGGCPFAARVLVKTHLSTFAYGLNSTEAAPLGVCGVRTAGTECPWRVATDRSRPKRGPPPAATSSL